MYREAVEGARGSTWSWPAPGDRSGTSADC